MTDDRPSDEELLDEIERLTVSIERKTGILLIATDLTQMMGERGTSEIEDFLGES